MDAATGPLRIALVAPPWFEVPPRRYGGIEWMCADLADSLVARGHDVTLIGAGAPGTTAAFVQTYAEPPSERVGTSLPELVHAAVADEHLTGMDVDVVHDHSAAGPLAAAGRRAPTVVTAHGPAEGELGRYYAALSGRASLVAISHAQRATAPEIDWVATVHNGVRVDRWPFSDQAGDYCLFLGRFSADKGVDLAIEAARAVGCPLLLAGKMTEPSEMRYFAEVVEPALGPDVEYVGEVGGAVKTRLLMEARCLLMPVRWAEPFGMVMIEAMVTGTPVVGMARGSVPEVVEAGVTGFVCVDAAELPIAIEKVTGLDRVACRERVARLFDVEVMASGYEAVYRSVASRG